MSSSRANSTPYLPIPITIIIILTLLTSTHSALSISDTHISTNRNSLRASVCSYYSANYTNSDLSTSRTYIKQYSYMNNQDIENILFNGNISTLKTNTILIIVPHLIAFIILLILWIPLCCCCLWPGTPTHIQKNIPPAENAENPKRNSTVAVNSNGQPIWPSSSISALWQVEYLELFKESI